MAQELTVKQEALTQKTNVELMLILEIDGFDTIYGSAKVQKNWRVGDGGVYIGMAGLFVGGVVDNPNALPLIDPSKSTKSISQQLEIDKGGSGSIQTIKIALTDEGGRVTRDMSPGYVVDDVLGQEATVFLGFKGGSHPEDSFRLFQGIIDTTDFNQGYVTVRVAHPSKLEDKNIFLPVTTELTSSISNSDTWIPVEDNSLFHEAVSFGSNSFETYIRINDEIIKYDYTYDVNGTIEFRGCERGQFGTTATSHESEDEVQSFYILNGDAIDLGLALLLSDGEGDFFAENIPVSSLVNVSSFENIPNALFFQGIDVKETYGLTEGDWIELQGAENPLNNFYEPSPMRKIKSFGKNSLGSWIVVDGVMLTPEISQNMNCRFKSQYNVLPDGCGLSSKMVDIQQFQDLKQLLGSSLAYYSFNLTDEINAKEFINEQLFMPSGLYQVPRKGRVSVDSTLPSIAGRNAKVLNEYNILNADKLSITRTINKNFYNSVLWKYDHDKLSGKVKRSEIRVDATAKSKIKVGLKPLEIESFGLKKGQATNTLLERQTKYFLDRYKNAAEYLEVIVNLKTGFNIDISDTVVLAGNNLRISDTKKGDREFSPRVMQVINKSFPFNGKITLTLLDTSFSNDGRYGTIAPSSKVLSGSFQDRLYLENIIKEEDSQDSEKRMWEEKYLGNRVVVRSDDFSQQAETKLISFDEQNTRCVYIDPPLPFVPSGGMIIDVPNYDESSNREMETYKTLHTFLCPQFEVTESIDNKSFKLPLNEAQALSNGSIIEVHSPDWDNSAETIVLDVVDDVVTVKTSFPFTPQTGYLVELIGFGDSGLPYRIL